RLRPRMPGAVRGDRPGPAGARAVLRAGAGTRGQDRPVVVDARGRGRDPQPDGGPSRRRRLVQRPPAGAGHDDHEAPRRVLTQARLCATEYDLAIDLMALGNVEGRSGRLDAARAHLGEAFDRFASIDESSGVAFCQTWLAELALVEADREPARRQLRLAMESFRGLH